MWWRLLPIALWCGYRPRRSRSLDWICRTTSVYRVSRSSSVSSTAQTAWEVRSWGTWIFLGYVTAETTFDAGGYTYSFDERGADGDRYVVIASASGDAKGGARWLDSAHMVEASSVVLRDEQGPLTSLASFLGDIDYRPFWVSIKTSGLALVIAFALGLFAAWKTMGTSSRIKGLLDSVFTIPMVLPPTVCGFLLLILFGVRPGWASGSSRTASRSSLPGPRRSFRPSLCRFRWSTARHSEPSRASTRRCSMRRARLAGPSVASLPSL